MTEDEAEEAVTISMASKKRFLSPQRSLDSAWHSEPAGNKRRGQSCLLPRELGSREHLIPDY